MADKKPFKQRKTHNKVLFISGVSLAGVVFIALSVVGGYLLYVMGQYYRIEDNHVLTQDIEHSSNALDSKTITRDQTLSAVTYNIGFGAYDQEYDFFLDEGEFLDGRKVAGTHAKALNYDHAKTNTDGSAELAKSLNADFTFIQELDKDSDRCYHINQYETFKALNPDKDALYSSNFHTAYLAYPFNDPIGKTESGLGTFSKYKIESAIRRSYPVDESFPTKFFDLDRSFSVSRLPLSNGKELVLGNSHMSAYDEGGKIRAQQLTFLNAFLKKEKDKGNYVVIGGDYNHDICESVGYFKSDQKRPTWTNTLTEADLTEGYKIAASKNAPTCRAAEFPFTKVYDEAGEYEDENGKFYISNYTVVIDGFIYSDNITKVNVESINNFFLYSDHNPAKFEFKLNL